METNNRGEILSPTGSIINKNNNKLSLGGTQTTSQNIKLSNTDNRTDKSR